jgi:hypothetical protein
LLDGTHGRLQPSAPVFLVYRPGQVN